MLVRAWLFHYIFPPNQTSGVEVDDNCIQSYIKLQLQHSSQFIIYRLSDDKKRIIVDKIGPVGCTYDNFVSELQNAGSKGEGRYGVFDFNYTVKERIVNKIVFFLWIPDTIQVKQRMLYSSSVRALKTRLPGIHIEMQCNDDSDLAQSNLLQRCLERGYD